MDKLYVSIVLIRINAEGKDIILTSTDFNNPSGSLLGLMTSILGVGAICATPFISMLGDRFGRRWGIWFGSAVMAVGGVIQGSSVHSKSLTHEGLSNLLFPSNAVAPQSECSSSLAFLLDLA